MIKLDASPNLCVIENNDSSDILCRIKKVKQKKIHPPLML